jgi:hypothetical protein
VGVAETEQQEEREEVRRDGVSEREQESGKQSKGKERKEKVESTHSTDDFVVKIFAAGVSRPKISNTNRCNSSKPI